MAFMAMIMGLGLLFYILLGSRYQVGSRVSGPAVMNTLLSVDRGSPILTNNYFTLTLLIRSPKKVPRNFGKSSYSIELSHGHGSERV